MVFNEIYWKPRSFEALQAWFSSCLINLKTTKQESVRLSKLIKSYFNCYQLIVQKWNNSYKMPKYSVTPPHAHIWASLRFKDLINHEMRKMKAIRVVDTIKFVFICFLWVLPLDKFFYHFKYCKISKKNSMVIFRIMEIEGLIWFCNAENLIKWQISQ